MDALSFRSVGPAQGGATDSLVVLLHGYGADGADLIGLAEAWGRAVPRAQFVAPDAPEPCEAAPWGRQWFGLSDLDPARLAEGVSAAVPLVRRFVDERAAAAGLSADPAPACILGFSGALLAGLGAARPPVLLVHGEADMVVPASATRAAASALGAAGVPVEALLRPGLGHGIDEAGIAAAAAFLARHLA